MLYRGTITIRDFDGSLDSDIGRAADYARDRITEAGYVVSLDRLVGADPTNSDLASRRSGETRVEITYDIEAGDLWDLRDEVYAIEADISSRGYSVDASRPILLPDDDRRDRLVAVEDAREKRRGDFL